MKQLFANEVGGSLASSVTDEGLSLVLQTGQAGLFPTPGVDEFFIVKVAYLSSFEIMSISNVVNDTLTILERELDGTAASTWPIGSTVEVYLSAGTLDSFVSEQEQTGHFQEETIKSEYEQSVFNLTEGTYRVGQKALEVYINGVRQAEESFTEIDSTTFSLICPLYENEVVEVRYLTTAYAASISAASISYFTPDLVPVELQSYIRSLEERLAKLENS